MRRIRSRKVLRSQPGTIVIMSPSSQKKKKFVAQDKVFQLDDEHSFKTLNEKPGTYEGSPGAAAFQVGRTASRMP